MSRITLAIAALLLSTLQVPVLADDDASATSADNFRLPSIHY
jgi:hypothetical protein